MRKGILLALVIHIIWMLLFILISYITVSPQDSPGAQHIFAFIAILITIGLVLYQFIKMLSFKAKARALGALLVNSSFLIGLFIYIKFA